MGRELPKGPGIEQIKIHKCEDGGLLYEFYRKEGFGQLAVRTVLPGVTVGGHKHPLTNEIWLVIEGTATIFLEYPSGTRWMKRVSGKKWEPIILPAGTGHDIKNVSETEEMVFIFFADRLYSSSGHDKLPWLWDDA